MKTKGTGTLAIDIKNALTEKELNKVSITEVILRSI